MIKIDEITSSTNAIHSKIAELQQNVSDLRNTNRTYPDNDSAKAFSKYTNALDWNFSFNHSVTSRASIGQTIKSNDLFTVIDNFERHTWTSLDALSNVLNEPNNRLTDVANEINSIDSRLYSLDNRITCTTGNHTDTNDIDKGAFAQLDTNKNPNDPEVSKMNEQKAITHNLSISVPGIPSNSQCSELSQKLADTPHIVNVASQPTNNHTMKNANLCFSSLSDSQLRHYE